MSLVHGKNSSVSHAVAILSERTVHYTTFCLIAHYFKMTIRRLFLFYLFCFCRSLSLREEEPRCCPFSNSSPAAFSTCPCTEVGSLAISGATNHTPERSEELCTQRRTHTHATSALQETAASAPTWNDG